MDSLEDLVGGSPGMIALRRRLAQILKAHRSGSRLPPTLIQGETGTGKGLLAKLLHRASRRAAGPFVDVNCAAIPETMLEAEMFGFERGAFTDARHSKAGLFQSAHGGSLFLDEVGLLPLALQAKLLKVLEERSVRRLGGTRAEAVDVWILAATNEDLVAAVRDRRFREDLYHRLAVVTLALPPLRERGNDLLLLVEHLLGRTCADYGLGQRTLGPDARAAITSHAWPGNVRELANALERAALLGQGPLIKADDLGIPLRPAHVRPDADEPASTTSGRLDDSIRERLHAVLLETQWNISRAAAILGLTRNTVRARMKKYRLSPPTAGRSRRTVERSPEVAVLGAPSAPELSAPTAWHRQHLTILRMESPSPAEMGAEVRFLEVAVEKVRSFGGTIDGITPGSLVAVFGADGGEDGPRQAAAAAQAILRAERHHDEHHPPPARRALVHVAEVTTGRLHGEVRLDWREVYATSAALDAVIAHVIAGEPFVTAAARPFFLRTFTVLPLGTPAGPVYRLARRDARLSAPAVFVGRREELAVMRSQLALCAEGLGQVIGLVGEPGIGKSRLVEEFLLGSEAAGVRGIVVRCRSDLATIPYSPIRQLVRALCGIGHGPLDHDTPDLAAVLVSQGLDPELIPPLLTIMDVPEGLSRDGSPETTKAGAARALRALIVGASSSRVHVIVVEDLHWIDQASRDLLSALVEAVSGRPVLLILTSRGEDEPRWLAGPPMTQLALQRLTPDDSARLLASLPTTGAIAADGIRSIVSRAGGNPFFLEELARVLEEEGPVGPSAVPATVHEVLLARMRRLRPDAGAVLSCAAAVGDDIPFDVLRAATALADEVVDRSISQLIAGRFLRDVSRATERVYAFQHALTRDVAYAAMTPEARRGLHARIVLAIEAFEPAQRSRWLDRLADHAYRAELWGKAVTYLGAAGAFAAGRAAYREAAANLELARASLDRLPRTIETIESAIDLLLELRTVYLNLAEYDRCGDCIEQAQALARDIGDGQRLGWASAFRAVHASFTGASHDRAAADSRYALTIAEDAGDSELLTLATFWLGRIHYTTGQYDTARTLLARAVALVADAPARPIRGLTFMPGVNFRTWLVWCLGELGEFGQARDAAREALGLAEATGQPYDQIMAGFGLGGLLARQGEFAEALGPLECSLSLGDELGIPFLFPPAAVRLAFVYAALGRAPAAWALIERIRTRVPALVNRPGMSGLHIPWAVWLAQAYLTLDAVGDARDLAATALEASVHSQERGHEAWLMQIAGDAVLTGHAPALDEADRLYGRALTLATDLRMRPLVAHCHAGRGMLLEASGREDLALGEVAKARDIFRGLGMTTWAVRLDTARALRAEP